MPQLNPAPWFLILVFSWFVLLTLIPPKILAHSFPQELSTQHTKNLATKAWNWTWQ